SAGATQARSHFWPIPGESWISASVVAVASVFFFGVCAVRPPGGAARLCRGATTARRPLLHLNLLVLVEPYVGFVYGCVVGRIGRTIGGKAGIQRGQVERLAVSPQAANHRAAISGLPHRPTANRAGDFARNVVVLTLRVG